MKVKTIETRLEQDVRWRQAEAETVLGFRETDSVCLYPQLRGQTFLGFGGAFTESAAYNWQGLPEKLQKQFMEDCFGETGLGYRWGRVPLNSCDFSLGHYACLDDPADADLKNFRLNRDKQFIFPMLRAASETAHAPISLMLSPWSPPAFMKSNSDMNHGGTLLPAYRALWAACLARYVREYRQAGFDVRFLSVQNEPDAAQPWDSCLWSAREEGAFVAEHLAPALRREGAEDVGILIWDHNKDQLVPRMAESLAVAGAAEAVAGAAFHWYSGDHFQAVALARRLYPGKLLVFSEGCVEYSRLSGSTDVRKAELYAHDILGNLNAGISCSLDWNLLLDAQGGPNHAGNFCEAPVMCAPGGGLEKKGSYYYIGHFSRWIRPGAVRVGASCWSDRVEATAFANTDQSTAVVLLNRGDEALSFCLRVNAREYCPLSMAPHSILTAVF